MSSQRPRGQMAGAEGPLGASTSLAHRAIQLLTSITIIATTMPISGARDEQQGLGDASLHWIVPKPAAATSNT